jgi:hypothetical protein
VPTLLAAAATTSSPGLTTTSTTGTSSSSTTTSNGTYSHLVHPSYVTSSSCNSSQDPSSPILATLSSQHHPYAYTNMATTNKISNTQTNLLVDSISHLPQIANVSSSPPPPASIESIPTNSIQSLSPNDKSNSSSSHSPQSTSTITPNGSTSTTASNSTQKRLHVSNIPFRFRDDDLKAMFEVNTQK